MTGVDIATHSGHVPGLHAFRLSEPEAREAWLPSELLLSCDARSCASADLLLAAGSSSSPAPLGGAEQLATTSLASPADAVPAEALPVPPGAAIAPAGADAATLAAAAGAAGGAATAAEAAAAAALMTQYIVSGGAAPPPGSERLFVGTEPADVYVSDDAGAHGLYPHYPPKYYLNAHAHCDNGGGASTFLPPPLLPTAPASCACQLASLIWVMMNLGSLVDPNTHHYCAGLAPCCRPAAPVTSRTAGNDHGRRAGSPLLAPLPPACRHLLALLSLFPLPPRS